MNRKRAMLDELIESSRSMDTLYFIDDGLSEAADRLETWIEQVAQALEAASMAEELETWRRADENRQFSPGGSFSQQINEASFRSDIRAMRALLIGIRDRLTPSSMADDELVREIEAQRDLMAAVATGGPRIQAVNTEYQERRESIGGALEERGLHDPNPHHDLWSWYGKWSSGDLPTYRSRREYLSDLYSPLVEQIRRGAVSRGATMIDEPTGWAKVDRILDEIRGRLEKAITEEQFQAVGLLCREALISLARAVYDASRYPSVDGTAPSQTDAKRMLEAYLSVELAGQSNEATRKHVKAAFDLTNDLQHKRTATFRMAAMCAEATTSVINLIAIISGRRDP
jgi:hypothetical protein